MNDNKLFHRWVWILTGFILVVGVGIALASCGGSSPQTSQSANQSASPTTNNLTPTQAWAATNAGTFTTIGNDLTAVSTASNSSAVSNGDFNGVLSACQQLQADVATAQALPAIPDTQAESDWMTTLDYLASGSNECVLGIQTNTPNDITVSVQDFTRANTAEGALKTDLGF